MKKLKVHIYEFQTWREISKSEINISPDPYIAICRVLPHEARVVGHTGYVVYELSARRADKEIERLTRRGIFWYLEYAKMFAEELSKNPSKE